MVLVAESVWFWVGVPASVREPEGGSLRLATLDAVGLEGTDSAVPSASV